MSGEPRLFVTGTDTDVGKTWVTAALALALRRELAPHVPVNIVKAVQTGLAAEEKGDAALAGRMARAHLEGDPRVGIGCFELLRLRKPADAYSAAVAERRPPPRSRDLAAAIEAIPGALVVEGAGGAALPLNSEESISHVAAQARLQTVVAVGLKLGCISHALLTAAYLRALDVRVLGAVLVERWGAADAAYREDVMRALAPALPTLALMLHNPTAGRAIPPTADALTAHLP
ncbi:MAG: dethiobiotin synthase [bacterium]|nr:dethiobiotin synthase [bacterium]